MKVWWKSLFWTLVVNGVIIAVAWSQGGRIGLAWGFLLALSINYYLIFYSPLRRLCPKGFDHLRGVDSWGILNEVRQFAERAKVPTPEVYVWDSPQIQCFVFSKWPGKGHFGISTAALKDLNPQEIQLLVGWSLLALRSGRVINWTFLGLFLNLVLILLSSMDRIMSWMVTKRINQPHGITLWPAAPLIFLIQRLFCRRREYLSLDQQLKKFGIDAEFSSHVIKKIHFQNQTHPPEGKVAFAHLYFSSQLPRGGFLPLLRVQPSFKKRIWSLRGEYPV